MPAASDPCASGQTQSWPPADQQLMRQRRALQMRNQSLCPVLSAESHHEPKRRTVHDRASTPQAHCPVASRSKDAHAERLRDPEPSRSEEHTSELQSLMRISYAVFCLKQKKNQRTQDERTTPN